MRGGGHGSIGGGGGRSDGWSGSIGGAVCLGSSMNSLARRGRGRGGHGGGSLRGARGLAALGSAGGGGRGGGFGWRHGDLLAVIIRVIRVMLLLVSHGVGALWLGRSGGLGFLLPEEVLQARLLGAHCC